MDLYAYVAKVIIMSNRPCTTISLLSIVYWFLFNHNYFHIIVPIFFSVTFYCCVYGLWSVQGEIINRSDQKWKVLTWLCTDTNTQTPTSYMHMPTRIFMVVVLQLRTILIFIEPFRYCSSVFRWMVTDANNKTQSGTFRIEWTTCVCFEWRCSFVRFGFRVTSWRTIYQLSVLV